MFKFKNIYLIAFIFVALVACQSVSNRIDEKTMLEEKELSKWLNQSETELKTKYGQPDKIEFLSTRNRNYIYISKKFNIKCERSFEINPKNIVIGYSSKNCF